MTLRLLCNENVPRALVDAFRRDGHDVRWISEASPGLPDVAVLRIARQDARICVTFDKDFGELAARDPAAATAGIILIRASCWPVERGAAHLAELVAARVDWAGHFSVIEPGRVRMRRIAPSG
jgi:predicted nuclease of predicted toxin-antitoxin system